MPANVLLQTTRFKQETTTPRMLLRFQKRILQPYGYYMNLKEDTATNELLVLPVESREKNLLEKQPVTSNKKVQGGAVNASL